MDEKARTTIPDGFVTDTELILKGIGADAQERGRRSGALKFAALGTQFVYRVADVSAWLDGEIDTASKTARARDKYVAERDVAGSSRQAYLPPTIQGARMPHPVALAPVSGSGAVADWNRAVADRVAQGMSKRQAVAQVDRERPGLREQMLTSVNRR